MSSLILCSPLHGWAAPLDEVPDPVFAERMMGDGVAIDPVGDALYAPCAGEVVNVHRAGHALTLRAANGAEILMHIGLETVALGGEGFKVHVREGQEVEAGVKLISFDLDLLVQRAKSLITPIILINPDAFTIASRCTGRELQVGEALMEIFPFGAQSPAAPRIGAGAATRAVRITHAHGLHARPAAQIAAEAKRLGLPIEVSHGGRKANARSPVALMTLGVSGGDEVLLAAEGEGAAAALQTLAELIERKINAAPASVAASPPAVAARTAGWIQGVRAAPGIAIGPAARLWSAAVHVREAASDPAEELRAFEAARAEVAAGLTAGALRESGERREILDAHLALLEDPELVKTALRAIAEGRSAGGAWRNAVRAQMEVLQGLGDPRLAERAADLKDLERQVLIALSGEPAAPPSAPEGAIVIAEDLTPSELLALQASRIAGVCTAGGGPTSHMAILAAAMDLPALVAAGPEVLGILDGTLLILDADAGTVKSAPTPAEIGIAEAGLAARAAERSSALAAAQTPCRTADGVRIEVFANIGAPAEAAAALRNGAEGCGLLRTEFLFLDRRTPPAETEQAAQYQAIAEAFEGRPMIVRTLDVGADKPAPYLALPHEQNPALGLRGVRVSLKHPDLLRTQLRAILGVEPAGQCRIMVPMVSSVAELAEVRRMAEDVRRELKRETPLELGVMIETPAAAVTADLIAAEADFLSIGTNDLAQYTLAMDRGDPALAAEVDALHPAVLRLIGLAVQGGRKHGRPVGVCGGLASDLAAVPILIGLGVTELSATPGRVPEVKALVRTLTLDACQGMAGRACQETSAMGVRALQVLAFQETLLTAGAAP